MTRQPAVHPAEIVEAATRLGETGLSVGTSGNLSARSERGFVITPSALAYETMRTSDLVELGVDGESLVGDRRPSTEWPFHAAIYRARRDVGAVIHGHPAHATALSCAREGIPPFHYMVAVAGGRSVRCAGFARPGSEELADQVVEALGQRSACLLANHGMVAVGPTLGEAFDMAIEIENLAWQYWLTRQLGEPVLLTDAEMESVLAHFDRYRGASS